MLSSKEPVWRNTRVEWPVIEEIISAAEWKFSKEREFNLTGELNLMRILASSSNILEEHNIDPSKDTDYYSFFLGVSRNMQHSTDWMSSAKSFFNREQRKNDKQELLSTINTQLRQIESKIGNIENNQNSMQSQTLPKQIKHMLLSQEVSPNNSNNKKNSNNTDNSFNINNNNNSSSSSNIHASSNYQFFNNQIGNTSAANHHINLSSMNKSNSNSNNNIINSTNTSSAKQQYSLNNTSYYNDSVNRSAQLPKKSQQQQQYLNKTTQELSSNLGFDQVFLDQALQELESKPIQHKSSSTTSSYLSLNQTADHVKKALCSIPYSSSHLADEHMSAHSQSLIISQNKHTKGNNGELFTKPHSLPATKSGVISHLTSQSAATAVASRYASSQEDPSNPSMKQRSSESSSSSQARLRHNVSFGETKDSEEVNLQLKLHYFQLWTSYVREQVSQRLEDQVEQDKLDAAYEYYATQTKHKALVILKGCCDLSVDRRWKIQEIKARRDRNIKSKHLQLFLLAYCKNNIIFALDFVQNYSLCLELKLVERQQSQMSIHHHRHNLLIKTLRALSQRVQLKKIYRNQQKSRIIPNRIYVEFIFTLLLTGIANLDDRTKQEIFLRVQNFEGARVIQILMQLRAQGRMLISMNTQTKLKELLEPQLNYLKQQHKQLAWRSWVKYVSMMQRFRNKQGKSLKLKVFQTWKSAIAKAELVQQQLSRKYSRLIQHLLVDWRSITVQRQQLRQRIKCFCIERKIAMIERYFNHWVVRFQYYQENKEEIVQGEIIRGNLVRKLVLHAWRELKDAYVEYNKLRNKAVRFRQSTLRQRVFDGFQVVFARKKDKQERYVQIEKWKNSYLQGRVLKAWKEEVLEDRLVQTYRNQIMVKNAFGMLVMMVKEAQQKWQEVEQVKDRKNTLMKRRVMRVLQENSIAMQNKLDTAYMFLYQMSLRKYFNQLKYMQILNHQRRVQANLIVRRLNLQKQFNVLHAWQNIALTRLQKKQLTRLAVNYYLRRLFKQMVGVLGRNLSQHRDETRKCKVIVNRRKRQFLHEWRLRQHSCIAERHWKGQVQCKVFGILSQHASIKKYRKRNDEEIAEILNKKQNNLALNCLIVLGVYARNQLKKKLVAEQISIYRGTRVVRKCFSAMVQMKKLRQQVLGRCLEIAKKRCRVTAILEFRKWARLTAVINLKRKCLQRVLNHQIALNIHQACTLWRESITEQKNTEMLTQKSAYLRYFLTSKKFFNRLRLHSKISMLRAAQLKTAEMFFLRSSFLKFENSFLASIQERKQKQISLKHYAMTILAKSFDKWAEEIKNKKCSSSKEQRFYSIKGQGLAGSSSQRSLNGRSYENQEYFSVGGKQGQLQNKNNQDQQGNRMVNGYDQLQQQQQQIFNHHDDDLLMDSEKYVDNSYIDCNDIQQQLENDDSLLRHSHLVSYSDEKQTLQMHSISLKSQDYHNENNIEEQQQYEQQSLKQGDQAEGEDLLIENLSYTGIQQDLFGKQP